MIRREGAGDKDIVNEIDSLEEVQPESFNAHGTEIGIDDLTHEAAFVRRAIGCGIPHGEPMGRRSDGRGSTPVQKLYVGYAPMVPGVISNLEKIMSDGSMRIFMPTHSLSEPYSITSKLQS